MNKYNEEAKSFLTKHNLELIINEAYPQKKPIWAKDGEDHGINYWCVLRNNDTKKEYGFDFWGSIADKENSFRGFSKRPTYYDILSCLDTFSDGESFENFCADYGYDKDSITAHRTFKAVNSQIEGLKNVLSVEALEELNEIR